MSLLSVIMSNPWLQVHRRQAFSALYRRSFLRGAFEIHWRERPHICRDYPRSRGSVAGSIDYWSSQFRGEGTRSGRARLRSLESGRTCPCRVLCSVVWAVSLLYFELQVTDLSQSVVKLWNRVSLATLQSTKAFSDYCVAYEQLALELQGQLNVAAVNCDDHRALCVNSGVKGYPTIRLWAKYQYFILNDC